MEALSVFSFIAIIIDDVNAIDADVLTVLIVTSLATRGNSLAENLGLLFYKRKEKKNNRWRLIDRWCTWKFCLMAICWARRGAT
jgi:hypothetical protein